MYKLTILLKLCQWKTFLSILLEELLGAGCTLPGSTWFALVSRSTPRSTVIRSAAVELVVRVASLMVRTTVTTLIIGQSRIIPDRIWTPVGTGASSSLLLEIPGCEEIIFVTLLAKSDTSFQKKPCSVILF